MDVRRLVVQDIHHKTVAADAEYGRHKSTIKAKRLGYLVREWLEDAEIVVGVVVEEA